MVSTFWGDDDGLWRVDLTIQNTNAIIEEERKAASLHVVSSGSNFNATQMAINLAQSIFCCRRLRLKRFEVVTRPR